MGIYDRDYYRGSGPSLFGSMADRGSVCTWLIIANVAFYVLQVLNLSGGIGPQGQFTHLLELNSGVAYLKADQIAQRDLPEEYQEAPEKMRDQVRGKVGAGVLQGQVWRLISYAFLHDPSSYWHILFNMLFLWWFGRDIEDLYGSREFLALYLGMAFVGGVAYVLAQAMGIMGLGSCIGASGAVTGILVLSALHYPSKVILLFFVLPVPIWLFVIVSVARDAFELLKGSNSGTAVVVHLAGAAFAFGYYKRSWRLSVLFSGIRDWKPPWSKPRLRVYREEPREAVPVAVIPPGNLDEQLEAKLDKVLEKVARFGQASLTEDERQILLRASEVYKRRRT